MRCLEVANTDVNDDICTKYTIYNRLETIYM